MWQETLDNVRAAGAIVKDGRVLLIHRIRDDREYWTVPGGSVEAGESVEQALGRELDEELGIKVLDKKLLFEIENAGRPEYYYLITKYEGEPVMGGPEMQIASESNQYILEEVELSRLSDVHLVPEELTHKLPEYLKED